MQEERSHHQGNKDEPRRCFKCGSKDHLVAQCPYNSENEDDDKKGKKKDKKEKKDKMTFKKKKKGGSYVVTRDSDASSSDCDRTAQFIQDQVLMSPLTR